MAQACLRGRTVSVDLEAAVLRCCQLAVCRFGAPIAHLMVLAQPEKTPRLQRAARHRLPARSDPARNGSGEAYQPPVAGLPRLR